MTRVAMNRVLGTLSLVCVFPLGAQTARSDARVARESLRSADAAMSGVSAMKGFVGSYTAAADDFVMLLEGAPILRGRDAVTALLRNQPRFRDMRVGWQPFRVLVSDDGTLGVTFGATALAGPNVDQPSFGRYVSVWRRDGSDRWRLVAQVHTGLVLAADLALPSGSVPGALAGGNPRDPFALADLAFARMARDSTAPVAFARFAAPNGMTFGATGELNLGPRDIQARLAEGPAARSAWQWGPVLTIAAPSGDLGVTIGEAAITAPNGGPATYSKYLTVWQRQADGSLRYVVDAGNARPRPR
jgi:ketosteroid isomerase-like protein